MRNPRGTILLVDDLELIHEVVRLVLEGHTLHSAFNARQAMRLLGENEVDLVLLEVNLPGMSGLELVREIRRRHPTLPVLMLSADFSLETVALAMFRGATGFLAKTPENVGALGLAVKTQVIAPERDD